MQAIDLRRLLPWQDRAMLWTRSGDSTPRGVLCHPQGAPAVSPAMTGRSARRVTGS